MLICLMIIGIKGDGFMNNNISPENFSSSDSCMKYYTDTEIQEIVNYIGDLEQFCEVYRVDNVKKSKMGNLCYVVFPGKDVVAQVFFSAEGKKAWSIIFYPKVSKNELDMIEKGDKLSIVMDIDPMGWYPFLDMGRIDIAYSYHCTRDGYQFFIRYLWDGKEYLVDSISSYLL